MEARQAFHKAYKLEAGSYAPSHEHGRGRERLLSKEPIFYILLIDD